MKRWVLKNGMTLLYEPKRTASVTVQVLVNVGSDWEKRLFGISHFIEHMVFEGTKKRKDAKEITNAVEKVGGVSNAYTTNARTCYHIKVPKKHFDVALDVTADTLINPLFRPKDTERQKNIIFKEIDLVTDEPRYHQWILFQKALFLKHPSRNPTYGTRASVKNVRSEDLWKFFRDNYYPKNMIIAIVGEVKDVKRKVETIFNNKSEKKWATKAIVHEPEQKSVRVKKEKRKDQESTYLIIGHRTVPRLHKDSYAVDIIGGILGRGQSGWMFDEIRNKRGLAYEVGTEQANELDFGFFATFSSVDSKNVEKVKELILQQLKKLEKVSRMDVQEAKTYIEGSYLLDSEDTQKVADELLFWEQMGDAQGHKRYLKKIQAVSVDDVRRVAKKYFSKPYVMAVIEGK